MTKKTDTKKSLLLSALSLVLCIAMLLGTTYAWFTDSVTSGKNTITAGNLDVELKHYNKNVTTPTDVKDQTNLFDNILWEPGVVAYENFVVSNEGNLALKYAFNLNVFDKNVLNGKDLSQVIKVATVDKALTAETRDALLATEGLSAFTTIADFQKTGVLETNGKSDTYGVILYWEPTENDNQWNVNNGQTVDRLHDGKNELFIEFGVNLVATQKDYESDSFGIDYDETAEFPVVAQAKVEPGKATKLTAYDAGNKLAASAVIPADDTAAAGASKIEMVINKTEKPSGIAVTTLQETLNLDVQFFKVTESGDKTPITEFANIVNVDLSAVLPTGAKVDQVYHTHGETSTPMDEAADAASVGLGEFYYDVSNMNLTIGSKTFSPFTIVYSYVVIASEDMLSFDTITLENKTSYIGKLKTDVPLEGAGTEANPYKVTKATELFKAIQSRDNTSVYIDIMNDINLGHWYPTYSERPLYINGNNHKLYGMKITSSLTEGNLDFLGGTYSGYFIGFIGYSKANLTITDLTFSNCVVSPNAILGNSEAITTNGWSCAGVICGRGGNEGNRLTFDNVTVDHCASEAYCKNAIICGNLQNGSVRMIDCAITNCNLVGEYNCGYMLGLVNTDDIKGNCTLSNNKMTFHRFNNDLEIYLDADGNEIDSYAKDANPMYALNSSAKTQFIAVMADAYTYQIPITNTNLNLVPLEEYRNMYLNGTVAPKTIRIPVNTLAPIDD